ncbi:MAG: hypothetical protein HWD61_07565 [Parachlamydiaceae bacterium]|nr:MAG: hypothetical protein HWD61_07565 [Parachlamydiaceae bacterium]
MDENAYKEISQVIISGKIFIANLEQAAQKSTTDALKEIYKQYSSENFNQYAQALIQVVPQFDALNEKLKELHQTSKGKSLEENFMKQNDQLTVDSFLITPIQRAPRHVLLVNELRKKPKEHP